MPHIIIEHSDNLETNATHIMRVVYDVVIDSQLFSPEAVKGRTVSFRHWLLPGNAQHFVHITIAILSGRTVKNRTELSQAVFKAVTDLNVSIDKISVDIREMCAETYCK